MKNSIVYGALFAVSMAVKDTINKTVIVEQNTNVFMNDDDMSMAQVNAKPMPDTT